MGVGGCTHTVSVEKISYNSENKIVSNVVFIHVDKTCFPYLCFVEFRRDVWSGEYANYLLLGRVINIHSA